MTPGEAVGDSEDSAIGFVDVEKWTGKSVTEQWGQRLYNFSDCECERDQAMWRRCHEKPLSLAQILPPCQSPASVAMGQVWAKSAQLLPRTEVCAISVDHWPRVSAFYVYMKKYRHLRDGIMFIRFETRPPSSMTRVPRGVNDP